jgi:hypothetical protein
MWQRCVSEAYTPEAVYSRFEHQLRETYPNRKELPPTKARVNAPSVCRGLTILGRILWRVGICSDYRKRFWRMAWPALRQLEIDQVIHVALVAHHLIRFARECLRGEAEKCFYGEAPPSLPARPVELAEATPGTNGRRPGEPVAAPRGSEEGKQSKAA